MGPFTCFGCGKTSGDSFIFCLHYGRKKGAFIEEMRLKDADDTPMNPTYLKMRQLAQKNKLNVSGCSSIIILKVLKCWN